MVSDVLRRYTWLIPVLTILLGSWLVADTVNAVIARTVFRQAGATDAPDSQRTMGSMGSRSSLREYENSIKKRNIFDSKNRLVEEDKPEEPADDLAQPSGDAEGCTMAINVLGTAVVINDPQRSLATIEDKTRTPAGIVTVSVGERIGDDGRLVWVDPQGIEIARGPDRRERCELTEEGASMKRPSVSISSNRSSRRSSDGPSGEGVKKVGRDKYVVAQDEVQSALNNLSSLATEARIVPYFENGQSKGFKLYSIKPNSLIAKIGIMNGDVIQKVNGYDINSPEKALQVYSLLKNENQIKVNVVRNGRPRTFEYDIR